MSPVDGLAITIGVTLAFLIVGVGLFIAVLWYGGYFK